MSYTGRSQPSWTGVAEAGFALSGDSAFRREAEDGEWVGMWLRFSDPCPGDYRLAVASHAIAPRRLAEMLLSPSGPMVVDGKARIILADGVVVRHVPDDGSKGVAVTFAAGLNAPV